MKAIGRVPVVEQVANHIRAYIQSDERTVGDKLPTEMALCNELGVGRGTVREALRILQAEKYVEILPGRGAFIASVQKIPADIFRWLAENEVELKDCFEIRGVLEPLAIKLAVQRSTQSDLDSINKMHERFLQAIAAQDSARISLCDEAFHSIITQKSQNQLLINICQKVDECIRSFRGKTFQLRQNALNAVEPHENIMRAILARDVDASVLYMKKHIQRIAEDLEDNIRK